MDDVSELNRVNLRDLTFSCAQTVVTEILKGAELVLLELRSGDTDFFAEELFRGVTVFNSERSAVNCALEPFEVGFIFGAAVEIFG